MLQLSIIIPAFNTEKTIENCLKSIFDAPTKATFSYEVIVIDDGSTDNTQKIIKTFQEQYQNLQYHYQKNSGVSSARNLGIQLAKGDYLCFVDADDELTNNWATIVQKNLQKRKAVDFFIFSKNYNGEPLSTKNFIEEICGLKTNFRLSTPWSKLYKTTVIKNNNLAFNTKIINGEDLLFNLNYLRYAKNPTIITASIYIYNHQPTSATKQFNQNFITSDLTFTKGLKETLASFPFDSTEIITFSQINAWIGLFNRYSRTKNFRLSKIRSFTNNPEYQTALNQYQNYTKYFSKAELSILWLLNHKLYRLVYILFKLKHRPESKKVYQERI